VEEEGLSCTCTDGLVVEDFSLGRITKTIVV